MAPAQGWHAQIEKCKQFFNLSATWWSCSDDVTDAMFLCTCTVWVPSKGGTQTVQIYWWSCNVDVTNAMFLFTCGVWVSSRGAPKRYKFNDDFAMTMLRMQCFSSPVPSGCRRGRHPNGTNVMMILQWRCYGCNVSLHLYRLGAV